MTLEQAAAVVSIAAVLFPATRWVWRRFRTWRDTREMNRLFAKRGLLSLDGDE